MGAVELVAAEFARRFGANPQLIVRAPGRVNLIGEHTDYNDGLVLPMAIDREICIAIRSRSDARVLVHSLDYDETVHVDLRQVERARAGWAEYLDGAAWVFREQAPDIMGWDGVIAGDVPRGAGLASSAAFELAVMRAFASVNNIEWNARQAALAAQRVENEWIGVRSGVMDQLVVASAREGHALLIDCRSFASHHIPIPTSISVIVLDTGTRRGLGDTAYNERRRECRAAARVLGAPSLRDVTLAQLDAQRDGMSDVLYRRARHVATENARTIAAAHALRVTDLMELGSLMNVSHASLRTDFEVTNTALDVIVELAQAHAACFGARMTGAGFGGCAVAIVDSVTAASFTENVTRAYHQRTGLEARAYVCKASNGVTVTSVGS